MKMFTVEKFIDKGSTSVGYKKGIFLCRDKRLTSNKKLYSSLRNIFCDVHLNEQQAQDHLKERQFPHTHDDADDDGRCRPN